MLGFLKAYGKVKAKDALNGVNEGIIKADLTGATQAQLDIYYEKLRDMSAKVIDSKTAYDKEQQEADDIVKLYNQKIDVVHVLQGRIEEATDDTTKASLTKSIESVLAELESLQGDVEREKQEAVDAKELLDSWTASRDALKAKLDGAQTAIKQAQTRINKAEVDGERAKELLESRRAQAGLSTGHNDMDTVLNTMNSMASKAERTNKVNRDMAETLAPKKIVVDDNIQSALNAVQGKSDAPTSLTDRLAGLKKI